MVQFLSGTGGGQVAVLGDDVQRKLDATRAQRAEKADELRRAHSAAARADLESAVTALDQQIAATSAMLGNIDLARATANTAATVSEPGPPQAVPRHVRTDVVLALCLGLTLGLLLAALLELLDPRAADGEAVAERIGAPVLGTLTGPSGGPHGDLVPPTTLLALRRCVARSGARTLVVVGSSTGAELAVIRRELAAAFSRGDPAQVQPAAAPADESSSVARPRPLNGSARRTATTVRPRSGTKSSKEAPPVRVVGLAQTDQDTSDGALVYVARPLTRYRDLTELRNLADATGWPVLGVLEAGSRPTGGHPR